MIDITPIIEALILLLATVITVILIPYIKSKTTAAQQELINSIVKTAVFGFEQIIIGQGLGAEKFDKAMDNIRAELLKRNITFTYDDIKLRIESMVKLLNIEQGK